MINSKLSFEQTLQNAQEILRSDFTISTFADECTDGETIQFQDKQITINYSTGGTWISIGDDKQSQYCPLDWDEDGNKLALEIKALVEKRLKEMGVKSSFFY